MKKFSSIVLVTLFLVLFISLNGNNKVQAQTGTSTPTGIPGAIVSIQPEKIYNNAERNVTILLVSKSTPYLLFVGDTPVSMETWTVQPSTGQTEIKIKIQQDFPIGSYKIRLQMQSGETIESITPMQVVSKASPQIVSIEPSMILLYPNEDIIISIHGKDIAGLTNAFIAGLPCPATSSGCTLVTNTDTEIVYKLPANTPLFQKAQAVSLGKLTLADDQEVQLPLIRIQDRIVPWNTISWVGFFVQGLLMVGIIIGSSQLLKSLSKDPVFSVWGVSLELLFSTFTTVLLIGIGAAVLAYLFGWSLTAVIITTMMAVVISLNYMYITISTKYDSSNYRRFFQPFGVLLVILSIGTPFFANSLNIQVYALWFEMGILLVTIILGTATLIYVRNQHPSDEIITKTIEDLLYQKGQVSFYKDLATLPKTRTDRILRAYFEKNKDEEGLSYDKKQKMIFLSTKIEEIQQEIQEFIETNGIVNADNELKQYPRGLANKALKTYFDKNKNQGDLEFTNGKLILTGQVNRLLNITIDQLIFRKGQVVAADFPTTGRARVIKALSYYFTEKNAQYDLIYNEANATLEIARKENIAKLNNSLEKLLSDLNKFASKPDQLDQVAYEFMVNLWISFGFGEGKKHQLQHLSSEFRVFNTTPSDLASILPTSFPIIVLTKTYIGEDGIQKLKDALIALNPKQRFSIFVDLSDGVTNRELVKQKLVMASQENIAVLNRLDLVHALASKQEVRLAFMELLQKQVNLSLFSPYHSEMPTESDMFFGRQDEIRTVVNSISERSVAILGARKIGKTSMLREIRRILSERGKLLLYLDCYHVGDYSMFFSEIYTRLDLIRNTGVPCANLIDFPRMLARLQELHPGQQVVFIFDEIDRLLKFDIDQKKNSEALFRLFRSLAQEGRCQFIFSGERTILDQISNPKSSFLNFTIPIKLGLLDNSAIKKLITEPMQLVGIHIGEPENVIAYIHKKTSGHPNLIQILCGLCVTELSESGIRFLDRKIVEQQAKSNDYLSTYQKIFWSQSTPLEKALSIGVIEHNGLTEGGALTYLKDIGFEISVTTLRRALEYLSLNQLLIKRENTYQLQPSDFPNSISDFTYEQWKQALLLESKQPN